MHIKYLEDAFWIGRALRTFAKWNSTYIWFLNKNRWWLECFSENEEAFGRAFVQKRIKIFLFKIIKYKN